MPTPTKGPRLGGGPAHERLILANLATSLFEHYRITTTEAKAKRLRPYAEHLITKAKRGDLAARRRVARVIHDKGVVHTLFTQIAPAVADRPGGYTRITKIGPRKGDAAPMAVIELVLDPVVPKQRREAPAAPKATGPAAPKAKVTEVEATETVEVPVDLVPDDTDEVPVVEASDDEAEATEVAEAPAADATADPAADDEAKPAES